MLHPDYFVIAQPGVILMRLSFSAHNGEIVGDAIRRRIFD